MNKKNIEFGVEFITERSGDRIGIAGRCYKGPIEIGDVFEAVYQYVPVKTLDDYARPSERIGETLVRLKVESMRAYGRSWQEIHEGLTAEMEVSGEGAELLKPGDVLGQLLTN